MFETEELHERKYPPFGGYFLMDCWLWGLVVGSRKDQSELMMGPVYPEELE
jgi:hypothetical protein